MKLTVVFLFIYFNLAEFFKQLEQHLHVMKAYFLAVIPAEMSLQFLSKDHVLCRQADVKFLQ